LAPARAQVASILETLVTKHEARWITWKTRMQKESIIVQESQQPQQNTQSPSQQPQPSPPQEDAAISNAYDLVVFDLDDTLVPVWHPIKPATEALLAYMTEHMPNAAIDAKDRLRPAMTQISTDHPLLAHDLTEVRKEALRLLAAPHGEEAGVEEAIRLFVQMRSNVAPHLYDDVIPCLEWLKQGLGVGVAVLTNGNAMDLSVCAVLGRYVSLSLGAGDVGTLKPSPVPFMAISQRAGVPPGRILFVGDSYEKDVLGAQAVGMTGALLLRDGAPLPEGLSDDVVVLRSLQPDEMGRQLRAHLLLKQTKS
jgi:FMN phosphatase YigB (HAD superfamily)